jgi:hypothetical protein
MKYKELAKTGEKVSVVGLVCMGISAAYGKADVELTVKDLEIIDAIVKKYPNIGSRYSARENKFVK